MIVYPSVLPANGMAFNFISDNTFDSHHDIVLSVEYSISGHANTEAGISFFVTDSSTFTGGVSGADLTYSGYYDGTSQGIQPALVGIGIDSTGVFGLSASGRDGFDESEVIANSYAVRAGTAEGYALSTFGNIYHAISSFNVVDSTDDSHILRFRVGNVSRALYLDYKANASEVFTNIATVDIGTHLDPQPQEIIPLRVGMGFTTPVSSNNSSSVAEFLFKTIHIEGLDAYSGDGGLYTYEGALVYTSDGNIVYPAITIN